MGSGQQETAKRKGARKMNNTNVEKLKCKDILLRKGQLYRLNGIYQTVNKTNEEHPAVVKLVKALKEFYQAFRERDSFLEDKRYGYNFYVAVPKCEIEKIIETLLKWKDGDN
jgi:hypothetical protein